MKTKSNTYVKHQREQLSPDSKQTEANASGRTLSIDQQIEVFATLLIDQLLNVLSNENNPNN